jgi:anti-sigma factor RsiW
MDCKECRDLMNEALDSQLGDKEVAFREHLEQCKECKREYEELVQMMRAVHDLPDFELPDGFRSRWQQAVRDEDKGNLIVLPLWRKRGFQMAMGIAAAALIAVNIPNVLMMGSQEMSMDEAPLEMAMEEPAMEPAEYMKDGEQESRGDFGQVADVAANSRNGGIRRCNDGRNSRACYDY